jgi:hypothetical protein
MEVSEFRKFLAMRPFEPIEICLDNGQKQLITHPEVIVTDSIIVAVDANGDAIFISPQAVSAVRVPSKGITKE